MLQRSSFKGAAIFLLLALVIATVASVPTSVLVQNSEMASNSNGKNSNTNNNNSNLSNLKVKRSSNNNNNMKESAASAAAALNKKSSPEIVPASYNSPPQTASFSLSSSSSPSMTNSARQGNAGVSSLPTNGDIINSAIAAGLTAAAIEAAAAASQRELEQQQHQQQYVADDYGSNNEASDSPTLLRKRGISSQQYLYGAGGGGVGGGAGGYGYGYAGNGDYYNNPVASMAAVPAGAAAAAAAVPNGVWADEIDPQLVYSDLQEFDDYAPRAAPYHNKAYDNLQNILNSETYLEPVALPLQYTGRYYGANADRKKRSNLNKLNKKYADMRLKRDTKLTPADMLALVALVEAGERARKDTDADASYITYPDPYSSSSSSGSNNYNYSPKNSYYPPTYDIQPNNNLDEVSEYNGGSMVGMGAGGGAWLEPSVVDYYGVPYNMETLPKYELPPREHKYAANNRYSNKRFMVSKKKRSMGQFLNDPVVKPSFSYSSVNGEKYF